MVSMDSPDRHTQCSGTFQSAPAITSSAVSAKFHRLSGRATFTILPASSSVLDKVKSY